VQRAKHDEGAARDFPSRAPFIFARYLVASIQAAEQAASGPTMQDTRTYNRFSDAAEEVVNARIYEGIHFRFADEDARKQGRHVAQWAFSHFLRPLDDE